MSDRILKNSVKCNKCGDVIVSYDNNRTTKCSCGNVSISGGTLALIREGNDYQELTEFLLYE